MRRPTAKPGNRIDLETVAASGSEGTNAGCAWQTLVAEPVELTGRSAPGIGNEVATAGIPVQNVLTTNPPVSVRLVSRLPKRIGRAVDQRWLALARSDLGTLLRLPNGTVA